jgi:ADP-heptose:LPS heptosyltransferase
MQIVLRNTQPMLGDKLMFTPCVRDLKASYPDWRIGVISAAPKIWQNNPYIEHIEQPDAIYDIGPAMVTKGSKTNGLHFTTAFRVSLEAKLGKPIKQGPFKPDIHLSEAEKELRIVDGHYWVVNTDTGPFSAKRWRENRWQELVDSLPWMSFVQVGLPKDNRIRLHGPNVIDLIGQTKVRELFALVYHAQGCVSLISSLMHVAAAFGKPCVVLAGAREPTTFEAYANHRYLDRVGCLRCAAQKACWHNSIGACEDVVDGVARCMEMIPTAEVTAAVRSYYHGGLLQQPGPDIECAGKRPVIRIVTKAATFGGAERSACEIAGLFYQRNWRVEFAVCGPVCPRFRAAVPPGTIFSQHVSRACELLLVYASDMVFDFDKPELTMLAKVPAERRVMALTYKLGKAGKAEWTKGWDRYLFLSSALRDGFLQRSPDAPTSVLAPPVDLAPFLSVEPDYKLPIRMARHHSQGGKKVPGDLAQVMRRTANVVNDIRWLFLPAVDGLAGIANVAAQPWASDSRQVAAFLAGASCFWYLLPAGYTDQGPRVIVEAMAAGLPVIAEQRDGPADRLTAETGWLVDNHAEVPQLIMSLTPEILAAKGRAARQRARQEFVKDHWYHAIAGTKERSAP